MHSVGARKGHEKNEKKKKIIYVAMFQMGSKVWVQRKDDCLKEKKSQSDEEQGPPYVRVRSGEPWVHRE